MQKEFLTIEEVSKLLSVSRQTVSRYIQEKRLSAIKINKHYRIHKNDFENFLSKNTTSVSEVKPVYSVNSKNCYITYEDKSDELFVINNFVQSEIETILEEHSDPFNYVLFGDNYLGLHHILERYAGKIDLIYIDPPFGTGKNFGDNDNELAYKDNLIDHHYLEFLRKRLILLSELLSEQGSIYVHTDKKTGHYLKIIMDEIFGSKNFINDITRIKCNPKNFARNAYGNYTDMILFYVKNQYQNIWNEIREPLSEEDLKKLFPKYDNKFGRYTTNPIHAPGITKNGDTGEEWNGLKPPRGRHWRYSREELTKLDEQGLIEWSATGNPRKIVPAKNHKGRKIQDVWQFKDRGITYAKYPTEKNYDMLKRIILNSSNEDSIVLDAFAGSGSTLLTADKLKRKWIGIDNSPKALDTMQKNFRENKVKANIYSIKSKY